MKKIIFLMSLMVFTISLNAQTVLKPYQSPWKYLDNGTNQGTLWKGSTFVDTPWATASGQFGYGDGDEQKVVSYGGNASNKYITTYFRCSLNVANVNAYNQYLLRMLVDDGAIVYVNGNEVYRYGLPAGTITYTTVATNEPKDGREEVGIDLSPSAFVTGLNVIAVEVHQTSVTSSDLTFDFQLSGLVLSPSYTPIWRPSKVIVCMLENRNRANIIGSANAPWINSLLSDTSCANFTQSYSLEHPSRPNYLDLFSGSNQGMTTADGTIPLTTPNLGRQIIDAGFTFTAYSDSLPSEGFVGDGTEAKYPFVRRHCPWIYWQGTGTNQLSSTCNKKFTQLPSPLSGLPTLSFIIPNQVHNMHDGTTAALAISNSDTWLQTNLQPVITWAKANNSLVILSFDEDEDAGGDNKITTLFIGTKVLGGTYNNPISHFNILHTIEQMYGLSYIGQSQYSSTILNCWK